MLGNRFRESMFEGQSCRGWPPRSRNYRVDILEASVEQNAVIWAARSDCGALRSGL